MRLNILPVVLLAMYALATAAFASDLSIALSPSTQTYPPSYNLSSCEYNSGTTLPCLVFSGTITDNDTDGSLLFLESLSLDFTNDPQDSSYFSVDNTFSNDVPGVLVGDPNAATDGSFASNVYTGPIFGVDISRTVPDGVYTLTAEFSNVGGSGDPNGNGFTQETTFTIVVTPEPGSWFMIIAGLVVIAESRRNRRHHLC